MSESNRQAGTAAPDSPLVYSVLVNYKNYADSDECIATLTAQHYPNHRVVVVDNASADGSLERLKEKWGDQVDFVERDTNGGVATGYNHGCRFALAAGAEFVVVCNNDIAVEPDFIDVLLAAFAAESSIGMAVPLTVYYDKPDTIWFAGIRLSRLLGNTRNVLRGQPLSRAQALKSRQVWDSDYDLTHATMISRRALEAAGAFDDRFFYGHDDVDYSLRLRRLGFRCVALGGTIVRHKVSATAGTRGSSILSPVTAFTYATGTILVGAKHYSGTKAPLFLAGLAIRAAYTFGLMIAARRWDTAAGYLRGLATGFLRYGGAIFSGAEARRRADSF